MTNHNSKVNDLYYYLKIYQRSQISFLKKFLYYKSIFGFFSSLI